MKWALSNFKFDKQNIVVQNKVTPVDTIENKKVKKNLGVVEVDIKKQINMS